MTLAPLSDDAVVFRLVSHNVDHFPPDATKPHPAAFSLTSDDRAEGEMRNIPPMLSVFDLAKTTVDQGRAIRNADAVGAGRSPIMTTPFGLKVSKVRAISVPPGFDSLDVLDDPLTVQLAGADGHAGIRGLDARSGVSDRRNGMLLIRSRLVDACYPL
jgi:hypothetical protein